MNTSTLKRYTPFILLAGDWLALLLFVAVGQRNHDLVNAAHPLRRWLLVTACFAAPWAMAGWRLGAFPRGDAATARTVLAHALNTWLVAAPFGIVLRAFALGQVGVARNFFIVGLVFGGLFLGAWRGVFWLAGRWASPPDR